MPDRSKEPRTATRERQEQILAQVGSGNHSIVGLAEFFGVSESTIRRDLSDLARGGLLVRTYGGAASTGHLREPTLSAKESSHRREKNSIGVLAASLVSTGDLILLDAGTTVGSLARQLSNKTGITVATNGVSSMTALIDSNNVDLIVLGGRLRRPNEALLGVQVFSAISRLRPDVAFLGADSLDPTRGISCPSLEQALIKEEMAAVAQRVYVLADHSKLGKSDAYPYWAGCPTRSGLITGAIEPETLQKYEENGWEVRLSEV